MIRHAGSRTRALYKWEDELLLQRATGGNRKVRSQKEGEFIINRIWQLERRSRAAPKLRLERKNKGIPYYETDDHEIVLTEDHYILTLIHEITHSLGYGPLKNPHSKAFVQKYLRLLSFQFGWSLYDLSTEAMKRKLL